MKGVTEKGRPWNGRGIPVERPQKTVERPNFGVERPKWGVEWGPFKKLFFLRVKYLQNIYMLQASFHTLSWTWCAWRIVIYMSGYMLQIWFTKYRPLLQNRASVQRPPFVGPFEFPGIIIIINYYYYYYYIFITWYNYNPYSMLWSGVMMLPGDQLLTEQEQHKVATTASDKVWANTQGFQMLLYKTEQYQKPTVTYWGFPV